MEGFVGKLLSDEGREERKKGKKEGENEIFIPAWERPFLIRKGSGLPFTG